MWAFMPPEGAASLLLQLCLPLPCCRLFWLCRTSCSSSIDLWRWRIRAEGRAGEGEGGRLWAGGMEFVSGDEHVPRNFDSIKEYVERVGSSSRVKSIDDWLPVTASRKAKWWYAAFHNVTAVVGAGVLGLPHAMAQLTWGPGIVILVLSWVITLFTFWQLVQMHEMVPGKRFDRYHELGQAAFGERLGLWIVVPQTLTVQVGLDIVYMVTGGASLQNIHRSLCSKRHEPCPQFGIAPFILVFGSAHFVLAQLPNFGSITLFSLAAAVMSISYSTIAWVTSLARGRVGDSSYHLLYFSHGTSPSSNADHIFEAMKATGIVAFAYAGHSVALEIQAQIPTTPEKPSKQAMWRGVVTAYVIVAFCYFCVAICGYWAFGNKVEDNILRSIQYPVWLVVTANLMVVIHVLGSYQMYAMPVYDMLEIFFVKFFRFNPTFLLRLLLRSSYVASTLFIATLIPFFDALLGFFGGFALAPTTYFMPCIIWLIIYKPRTGSVSWFVNWVCIILGFSLMFSATIGGFRTIYVDAKTYRVFHRNQT